MSQQMKKRWADPRQRECMAQRSRERALAKWRDPQYRKRQLAVMHSAEARRQLSVLMAKRSKGFWSDPEYVARQQARWTPERKAQFGQQSKERWDDGEYRKQIGKRIAATWTPARKKAMGKLSKARWSDPEYKARMRKKAAARRIVPEVR
jgi:hypothetical protein